MTPTETLSALSKVQIAIDMLVNATMFKDHPAESQAAIEARDFFLPQIIAAVEEGQVGVNETSFTMAIESLGTPDDEFSCWHLDEGNLRAFVARLRTPLPLPPSSQQVTDVDALRAEGWTVAVHNDYRLNGVPHTFWLFTKGEQCAKGEGRTDAEALAQVKAAIEHPRSIPPSTRKDDSQ